MAPSENINPNFLGLVFNHLVLPPEIPGTQDDDVDAVSHDIGMRITKAINTAMGLNCDVPWKEAYQSLQDSLQACVELNRGSLDRSSLVEHFERLLPGQTLILYLNEQNAGLLMSREPSGSEEYIIFESFEASACSSSVLAANHAMQWDFPGRSARIDLAAFSKKTFQESLAQFLEQASMESLHILQASTKKAGVSVGEIRDTTDPALITQLLMTLLEAVGSYYQAPVLRKRIRDDVNLGKSGNIPWRRLPFWLVLRVAAQRQLRLALGAERGLVAYKFIIAIILAELLEDSTAHLSPQQIVCLRTKLARRMVKLEMLQEQLQLHKDVTCYNWCTAASAVVRRSIESANMKVEVAWDSHKRTTMHRVAKLPDRAPPESLKLTLPNCGSYLDKILSTNLLQSSTLGPVTLPSPLDQSIERGQRLTKYAFDLAALEEQVEREADKSLGSSQNHEDHCLELERQIKSILDQLENASDSVGSVYDSSPEQNSATILAIFTLWVKLDQSAIKQCALLADHAPVFPPELLDALQLPMKPAMERLQQIQEYLAGRHDKSIYGSILETPNQNSIAQRYVRRSNHLRSLERQIQESSDHARQLKENEHIALCKEFDKRTEGILDNTCYCKTVNGERIVRGCERCWHWRVRNRIKIEIHEAFLPQTNPARSTIIFELGIPEWLSAYRDVSWQILSRLAHPHRPKSTIKPSIHLQECRPLKVYAEETRGRISLASKVKCFEQTHYKFTGEKAPLLEVILPFAAEFKLYDSQLEVWVEDLNKPLTLEHRCGIQVPRSLLAILPNRVHPPTVVDGPSSYKVQANQTLTPKDVSVQEFSAYQKLLAIGRRRWPNLLVELSSSNLNLGDEDTMHLICQLASQAGPRLPGESRRVVHEILKHPAFTTRLTTSLHEILESIRDNWREYNIMRLVITLTLRLQRLSEQSLGTEILITARKYVLEWIAELQTKSRRAKNSAEAQQYATYGLHAALLCRGTFAVFIGSEDDLSQEDLSGWLQASIALQENILHDIGKLFGKLPELLFHDAKMVYHLRTRIKRAMRANRSTVATNILRDWSYHFADDRIGSSAWNFLSESEDCWIITTTPCCFPSRIHFNYLEGHLLVNGKPRSKLPLDIADDDAVKFIFGDQHLLTYPSNLAGMSHRLVQAQEDHEVHFGLRDNHAIIRATRWSKKSNAEETLEFIPSWRFSSLGYFDLPSELVQNCGHWLNISTQRLEIRRSSPGLSTFWVTRPRDWILHVPTRRATRGEGGSGLVDPYSDTFSQVAKIFRDFEQPDQITVFQPLNAAAKLTVELKRMGLSFEVNRNQRLQCQQLRAEIDSNQDAGTWYGLRGKIVMREMATKARSIIVPLGVPIVRRNQLHVDVRIKEASQYAKFEIDAGLGRLSCSPELRLIYNKALYHALTSFCLPDPLTGRTGSGEAFSILQSGAAIPWESLTKEDVRVLGSFSKLIPQREFYPPGVKRIQRVIWDADLTSWIQCDGYQPAIQAIKKRSNSLATFNSGPVSELTETSHLCHRGRAQRQLYDPLFDVEASLPDIAYTPRDRQSSAEAVNVFRISRVILSKGSQFHMYTTLMKILESSKYISGFPASDRHLTHSNTRPLINQIEDSIDENWGELVDFCRHGASQASLLFRLGLLAFHKRANMDAILSLAALYLVEEIKDLEPPRHECFTNFRSREPPSVHWIESLVSSYYIEFKFSSIITHIRSATDHQQACRQEGIQFARRLQQLWPMPATDVTSQMLRMAPEESEPETTSSLIDVDSAWDHVKPEWQRRYTNIELSNYVERVDKILDVFSRGSVPDTTKPESWIATEPDFTVAQGSLSYQAIIQDWTAKNGPVCEVVENSVTRALRGIGSLRMTNSLLHDIGKYQNDAHSYRKAIPPTELGELGDILANFEQSDGNLRKGYAQDLQQSLRALETMTQRLEPDLIASDRDWEAIREALDRVECHARTQVKDVWTKIAAAFTANDNRDRWLKLGGIRPLSTPIDVLKLLRSTGTCHFGPQMKEAIVSYGIAVTNVQHLTRIRHALRRRNLQSLHNELLQEGHEAWEPIEVPDWLLLEIEYDILIRPEQIAVAKAIIDPTLGNGVLQLSMGKGKTSCIIPMVECVLADGQSLSRVVVPKALLSQTAQTLQSRLGGLVGREVMHIPYSRRTSTTKETLDLYAKLHQTTQRNRGIMLTCADHLLSHKLLGLQKLVDCENSTANQMTGFQNWLDTNCRDVLDECDFTLSVKTQLNYPSGPEMLVDFHPYRWQIVQELCGLVESYLPVLEREHPRGIQIISSRKGDGFPAVQFLNTSTENALHELIIEDICSGRLSFLRPAHPQYKEKRHTIRQVLYEPVLNDKTMEEAVNLFATPQIAENTILLVRGLLLDRILVMCLGKRWNVQYGLHPERDPIAVPFEAKGKPSEQAEYGHPDVSILFTCLSFYYSGLTLGQLTQGVRYILQSNDPAAQYELWASTCTKLPKSLRAWNMINADDKGQMERLWRCLRLNCIAINHYLNHFVFPLHARQFKIKLQACSWDIPIYAENNTQLTRTSGFSGTNDNRLVLPLTISQRDLPEMQHTSAEVLSYLLQARNRHFHAITDEKGMRLSEKEFLRDLKVKKVSVLIDAGAYISDMSNEEVAHTWLQVDTDVEAVVYFRNDNRAWVHYRSQAKEDTPLLATPLVENLSKCNVFLDDAHTRGVDLKLPMNARGALTLQLKLTKDHAVQAAMRLRQLKTTQSICFYGPPEVEQSIRDYRQLSLSDNINSSHIVSWLLEQTCRSIEDLRGLYIAQGVDFCQRTDAILHCMNFMSDNPERQKVLQVLQQPERKTLKELYGPASEKSIVNFDDKLDSLQLTSFMNELESASKDQHGRFLPGALEEVEQEKEVQAQVEEVRQIEKRRQYDALKFPGMHPDILQFARTGILKAAQAVEDAKPGFEHAFAFVGRTKIGKTFGVHKTNTKLFVSTEFANTIEITSNSHESDNFLRPVEWIAWSPKTETALVIIPEEAEHLLGILRDQPGDSYIHLITYAAPVTKAMIHFNSLEFYSYPEMPSGQTVSERIRIELGILAGRLYVNQSEWKAMAEYVGGAANDPDKIAADPAAFILEWLGTRRKTVNVLHTHMGRICTGREMESAYRSNGVDGVEEQQSDEQEI
ncbi:hypothetical protein F5Y03DRAFT_391651 [Xylaria venustula]|nr:hypothetical protein F5Y03DRAFT_391651 [Xylaria venustula]